MAVNSGQDFEAQKSASIIKSTPHVSRGLMKAFWSESMHLCESNNFKGLSLSRKFYSENCDYKIKNKVPIRVDFWISICFWISNFAKSHLK